MSPARGSSSAWPMTSRPTFTVSSGHCDAPSSCVTLVTSSRAIGIPRELSSRTPALDASAVSSARISALNPDTPAVIFSVRSRRRTNRGSLRSLAAMLTDIFSVSPSLRQTLACSSASRSTHAVSSCISPSRAAVGRKACGDTRPFCGCFQRTSASTPRRSSPLMSKIGW